MKLYITVLVAAAQYIEDGELFKKNRLLLSLLLQKRVNVKLKRANVNLNNNVYNFAHVYNYLCIYVVSRWDMNVNRTYFLNVFAN